MNQQNLSALMRLSWAIQRKKKSNRSKALILAWLVYLHRDIITGYMVLRSAKQGKPNLKTAVSLKLF